MQSSSKLVPKPHPNKRQRGVTLLEYALIAVLVAVAAIAAMTFLGTEVGQTFNNVANKLNATN